MFMLRRRRVLTLVAAIAATTLSIGSVPDIAQAATVSTPPFSQCPSIGNSASCEILLVVNADSSISVLGDPSVGTFDGSDDTLVGIVNNSTSPVTAVTVSGPGTDLSGFDGDGICSGDYGAWAGSSGCPYGPTGYEGPGTSFVTASSLPDSVEIDFTGGLKPAGSAYFSLEGALTSAELTGREGGINNGTCDANASYVTEAVQHARSDNTGRDVFTYGTSVSWCLSDGQVLLKPAIHDFQIARVDDRGFIEEYLSEALGLTFRVNRSAQTVNVSGTTCEFSGVKFISQLDLTEPIESAAELALAAYFPFIRAALEVGGPTAALILNRLWVRIGAELPTVISKLINLLPASIREFVRDKVNEKLRGLGVDFFKADAAALTAYVLAHVSPGHASTFARIDGTINGALDTIKSVFIRNEVVWAPDVKVTINGTGIPAEVATTGTIGAGLFVAKETPVLHGPFL